MIKILDDFFVYLIDDTPYILRDPRKVMRSVKNLPRVKTNGSQDGESRQYHPIVYALYWKIAYQKVQAFVQKNRAPVKVVRFEDLIKMPEVTALRLADFLNTQVTGQVIAQSVNSSLRQGGAVKELTGTEVLICEKMAGQQMQAMGYCLSNPLPKPSDGVDLIKTSLDFIAYQIGRVATNKRARTSITAFVKNLNS